MPSPAGGGVTHMVVSRRTFAPAIFSEPNVRSSESNSNFPAAPKG